MGGKKGDIFISVVLMFAASILSVKKFMNGSTTDGILWLIVAVATLLREIIRNKRGK
ncbi:MAG: hypothetical protein PUA77_09105 [Lachnospiraceae bacterium]|nr:hypothetical protein [Lachnospiraceae bacterium]